MTAEVVAVGTELLLGDIVDTNSAELGKTLARFGVDCFHRQTVGDNWKRLSEALRHALARSDIVFTVGGLGPTQDDITRDGIAAALRDQLVFDPALDAEIKAKLETRGIRVNESQSRQAMRPMSATAIANPNGTAPGLLCSKDGKVVIAMPGPRLEFVPMLHGPVSDYLASVSSSVLVSRTLKVVGVGESLVEERLSDLMASTEPTVAPYAKTGEVHVRITARATNDDAATQLIVPVESVIRERLGSVVYGADDDTLESVVLDLLRSRGETLGVAESCTGGGLGRRLTSVAGSSDVFLGGAISYSNALKKSMLGVSEETLRVHGAVSEQCALEMARGARERTAATWAVSVTGIAGPDGGTDDKPVGLVYVGVSGPDGEKATRSLFPGTREGVRARSETASLNALRNRLQ